ncbi:NmrA family NAD(P)-binding protein [Flavobacterium sp.]|uniref:NmrA family NAD(P)-binding protein n=1 Tax=Flavobacterium sp. TaxID=239 RepID=UPI0039E245F5
MILVTGATGGLGGATIDALLNLVPAKSIVALARDEEKAQQLRQKGISVRIGDYDDYDSLVQAFYGIEKLVLVSAPALSDQRHKRESNAVQAAKEAGVKHIIFTGIQNRKDRQYIMPMVTEVSLDIEQQIKESGMAYTIVENSIYADSVSVFVGSDVLKDGVIFPAGEGRIAYVTRVDLGEGIAKILIGEGHENKKYTLSNTTSWSFADIAAIIGKAAGKSLDYTDASREDFIAYRIATDHLPEFVAGFLADWGEATKQGEFAEPDPILEKLLGRKPMSLEEYLATEYGEAVFRQSVN